MTTSCTLPLWAHVLVAIHNSPEKVRYCEKLNRKVQASRSHIRTIVGLLKERGMITIANAGKTRRISLTESGTKLALSLQDAQICLRKCC